MGIYIKNIKMPKKCYECPCYWYDRGDGEYIHNNDGCKALGETFNEHVYYGVHIHDPFKGIYEDCPLVEISTPHGRLIDADSVLPHIEEEISMYGRRLANLPEEPNAVHQNAENIRRQVKENLLDARASYNEVEQLLLIPPTIIEAED